MKLKKIVPFLFFLCVFISFLSPISDVDFPWHLKTGEYIYQHREIPKIDPFSLVSTGDARERFILSSYWLGQLVFYGIYSLSGPLGIITLRSFLLTGIIIILWFSMKKTPILIKIGILYLTARLFLMYAGDRPQLFSFFFAAFLIGMLENYRKTLSIKYLIFLPLIMFLWANLHGGFIFGDVTIAVYCLTEAVKYFVARKTTGPLEKNKLMILVVIGFVSVVVSYLNPNNFQAITLNIEAVGDPLYKAVREYTSPLSQIRGAYVNVNDFIYWSVAGYGLVLLGLNLRRLDLTHLGLIFFTLYLSLSAIRFLPFFVITALFLSGQYKFNIIDLDKFSFDRKLRLPVMAISILVVLLWGGNLVYSMPPVDRLAKIPESKLFPERAVRFVLQNMESGRIFNSYNNGSYLLWRLSPRFKTFIDTRCINYKVFSEWQTIAYAGRWEGDPSSFADALTDLLPEGSGRIEVNFGKRPLNPPKVEKWKALLDERGIDIIIHEACNFYTGDMYALVLRLIRDERWKLVHSDGKALIFVRDVPRFKDLIEKYGMNKEKIYDEIGMENASQVGRLHPATYSSLAFALSMKGNSGKIVDEYLRHALYLNPKDLQSVLVEAFLKLKRQKG